MRREASCQCGQVVVECSGEPVLVAACHCLHCQRRTGAPFGIGAFYARTDVRPVTGTPIQFKRTGDSGSAVTSHFCGTCGSTVWWQPERAPSMVGVAVGAFADPGFPMPTQAGWAKNQHAWLSFPDEVTTRTEGIVRQAQP